jgi:hypothetical protein
MSELMLAEERDFFAPAQTDLIDELMAQYRHMRAKVESVAAFVADDMTTPIDYFLKGNDAQARFSSIERMFSLDGALKALNAAFWSKALNMSDVLQVMPQKRRDEWSNLIHEMKTPEFEESSVRATIEDLLLSREKFFAEKVDGIFRALSHEHVTNCPQGFRKRMILSGVTEGYYYTSSSQCGHINDLRAVIAKFMGRDEPRWNSTNAIVRIARQNSGQWMLMDGGSMRIRVYMKGTAHLEIHPDVAWWLNQILASLYPRAIPGEFRTKPTKKHKEFQMMEKPLPFAVLEVLSGLNWRRGTWKCGLPYGGDNKAATDEACRVIQYIGGAWNGSDYEFEYDAHEVVNEIIVSGCIPDRVSHQYYPTPESVAIDAVEMADIQPGDICLEPSAGQGGLADLMPKDQTICVELSPLHCKILEAKGFDVINCDFLQYQADKFDRIVMNPPYSEGRWGWHLSHAASMLKDTGTLVAILPASAKNKAVLPDQFNCTWSRTYANEFAGTSVSVVILKATLQ